MLNKILVFVGGGLVAILVFSNIMNSGMTAAVLWTQVSVWKLIIITTIIGMAIGYGLKGFILGDNSDDDGNF